MKPNFTIRTFASCLMLALPSVASAQKISPKVVKSYNKDVVVKLYNITSKVELSDAKQLQLAAYYKTKFDQIAQSIINGKPSAYIDSLQRFVDSDAEKLLSDQDLTQLRKKVIQGRKGSLPARFALVIDNAKEIGLSDAQSDSINACYFKYSDLKLSAVSRRKIDPNEYEREVIRKILNDQQYERYLEIKNSGTALNWAVSDWAKIKNYGLDKGLDSAKTVEQIKIYDQKLLTAREIFRDKPAELSHRTALINNLKPAVLNLLKRSQQVNNPTVSNGSNVKTGFAW